MNYEIKMTDEEKEQIISEALSTPEGQAALAAAMVGPISQPFNYASLGRNLLMVNELPLGAFARYERDIASCDGVVTSTGPIITSYPASKS